MTVLIAGLAAATPGIFLLKNYPLSILSLNNKFLRRSK